MRQLLPVLFLIFILASCSEGDGPSVTRSADDYLPNTVGSTWSYTSSFFDFSQTITKKTKSIAGKSYFEIRVELNGLPAFMTYGRKKDGEYINREVYEGQYDNGEYIFLKDAPEGTTWTEYTYNDGIETIETLEITEVGGSFAVGEEPINNVIVVKVSSLSAGATEPYVIYNYYAKGVGLIKVEDDADLVATELLEYFIEN